MRTRSKLAIAALAATAMLGLAVGSATAGRFSLPNSEQGFRYVWTPIELIVGGRTMRCNLTLEGSFTRSTTTKTQGNTISRITRAAFSTCSGGTMRANAETLPWEQTYQSFSGTLPSITGLTQDLVNMSFELHPEGLPQCRATTEEEEPFRGIANVNASGEVTTFRTEESSRIGTAGGFLCEFGTRGALAGTAAATVLGGTAHTRVTLI